ncbi:MAG TPA: HAD family hydrolase [Candidatus Saccharibacteria bacterium]|nr:HAD family hydrolase [Candidatus Saccharibacteria bacterium]
MSIRLVVTDVDDTLVIRHSYEPDAVVRTTILRLQAAGIQISIASARPADMVKPVLEHLGLTGPQVIDGGASVYDFARNTMLWQNWLELDRLRLIVSEAMQNAVLIDCFPELRMEDIQNFSIEHVTEPAPYVYVKIHKKYHASLWKRLRGISAIAYSVIAKDDDFLHVQICDEFATKQHGVAKLQEILNISKAETLAIGDAENDLSLFASAKHKVAMGNAVPEVKRASTYITSPVNEDGWAKAMEHFGL